MADDPPLHVRPALQELVCLQCCLYCLVVILPCGASKVLVPASALLPNESAQISLTLLVFLCYAQLGSAP